MDVLRERIRCSVNEPVKADEDPFRHIQVKRTQWGLLLEVLRERDSRDTVKECIMADLSVKSPLLEATTGRRAKLEYLGMR